MLLLIQFIFHSLGGASVLFRFFHSLGGVKPFPCLVLLLIQFIFSFARGHFFIYVILVCFKIVGPHQNPYFSSARSRWTVVTVSSDLVLHFRLKISSFLPSNIVCWRLFSSNGLILDIYQWFMLNNYLHRHLANEGIVTLGVAVCVCEQRTDMWTIWQSSRLRNISRHSRLPYCPSHRKSWT